MTETESNGKRIIFKCGMVYIKWFFSTINNGKRNCVTPVNVDVESVYGATMHLCKPSICNKKKNVDIKIHALPYPVTEKKN